MVTPTTATGEARTTARGLGQFSFVLTCTLSYQSLPCHHTVIGGDTSHTTTNLEDRAAAAEDVATADWPVLNPTTTKYFLRLLYLPNPHHPPENPRFAFPLQQ